MAEVAIDEGVIQRTQESLGKIIKKPPLTEKLLRKPPFKFLQDIVLSVIKTTGFMQGVFTDEELNSENAKDRDAKIAFLQKAVDHVSSVTGEPLKIRPGKTVAGHEAERTNEFLQALAKAIEMQNEFPTGSPKKEKSPPQSSSKKTDKKERNGLGKPSSVERKRKSSESSKAASSQKKIADEAEKINGKASEKSREKRRSSNADEKTRERSKENKERRRTKDRSQSKENGEAHRSKSRDKLVEQSRSSKASSRNVDGREARSSVKGESSRARLSRREAVDGSGTKKTSDRKQKTSPDKKSPEKVRLQKVENGEVAEEVNASPERMDSGVERDGPLSDLGSVVLVNGDGGVELESSRPLLSGEAAAPRALSGRPPTGRPATRKLLSSIPGVANDGAANVTLHSELRAKEDDSSGPTSLVMESNGDLQSEPSNSSVEQEPVKRPSTSTIRRSSARPPTARPAAPRVRVVEMASEDTGVPLAVKQVANIILDSDVNVDNDEDETFVVEEPSLLLDNHEVPVRTTSALTLEQDGKEHGSLVTQILETKKDLESGSERPRTSSKKIEVDIHLSDSARRKEREMLSREVERLREGVQTLTRSANPLGKLVDYLQEDVDSMLRELDRWALESRQHELALQQERSKNNMDMDDLNEQMQTVEESIEDMLAKICTVKAAIIRNEEKIQKFVSSAKA